MEPEKHNHNDSEKKDLKKENRNKHLHANVFKVRNEKVRHKSFEQTIFEIKYLPSLGQ